MISRVIRISARTIAFVLVMAGAVAAQERIATASVNGKVTVKNKGVAGVVVFAEEQNPRVWTRSNYRATTDQIGNYRITNLPAATYVIKPMAPSFALEDEVTSNSVAISEGENVENMNFSMVPGGVITGKVTDADGKPLIEQYVMVYPIDATVTDGRWDGNLHTDDRGIYRAFGLRPGKYKVSVGQNESLPGGPRPTYRRTFYPSVTDMAKATVIEVTAGSEATNIDIVVGRPVSTFRVSGRILDAETGKPLSGINYGIYQGRENGGSSMVGRNFSNANGEFKIENVLPGNYVVFIVPGEGGGVRGDSTSVEVVDHDVDNVVIKAGKASSLSGVVVLEGAEGSAAKIKPNDLFINAWAENTERFFGGNSALAVNPDGSFRIGGLQKGRIRFGFQSRSLNDRRPVELKRVERDGVELSSGLTLKDGEQVTGLRLIVKYLTGAIHGKIEIEGDESVPNSRLSIWLEPLDPRTWYQSTSGPPSPQLDSRKRFVVQGLSAGTYEVNVAVYDPGRYETSRIYKQQVTVNDNMVSEVTVTIKTKP